MSEAAFPVFEKNTPPVGVELKSPAVNIADLDGRLRLFLATLGLVHLHLFNAPAVVTSGKDSVHVESSKHGQGKAVDLRVSDLREGWQQTFLLVVCTLCDRYGLTVFDERNLPGGPHFHVEVAG